jgi:hypothetical protein
VRASKKLRSDELYLTSFASTRLRMELDRVPLWRGNHVAVKQLVEDFARYLYLPRLKDSTRASACDARRDDAADLGSRTASPLPTVSTPRRAATKGLRAGQMVMLSDATCRDCWSSQRWRRSNSTRNVRRLQWRGPEEPGGDTGTSSPRTRLTSSGDPQPVAAKARRFHGAVTLDPARVGRDASRIAEEVIAHLSGLVGATVTVTLEVAAAIPAGVPDHVVRTVTENSRTLKFTSQGFEKE